MSGETWVNAPLVEEDRMTEAERKKEAEELGLPKSDETIQDRIIERRDIRGAHLFQDLLAGKYLGGKSWIFLVGTGLYYPLLDDRLSRLELPEEAVKERYEKFLSPTWHDHIKIRNPYFFGRGIGHYPTEAFYSAFRDAARREKAAEAESAETLKETAGE